MPTYQDSEASVFKVVETGDYILTVFEYSSDISTGPKTRGCDRFNIVFNIEGTDSKIKESLIDAESCLWKLDTFLKSAGIRDLKKGQGWHFEKDKAEELGVPWINPMGLRLHAHITKETFTNRAGETKPCNRVGTFYTDRSALPPDPELRKKPMKTEDIHPDSPAEEGPVSAF